MKKFSVSLFLVAILVAILFVLSGCGPTVQTPPPATPTICTLTVYSQCFDCWGYVWVNGISTGKYIDYNGMVEVNVPCGVVSVEIRDEYGNVSHPEIVQTPQQRIVIFTYW